MIWWNGKWRTYYVQVEMWIRFSPNTSNIRKSLIKGIAYYAICFHTKSVKNWNSHHILIHHQTPEIKGKVQRQGIKRIWVNLLPHLAIPFNPERKICFIINFLSFHRWRYDYADFQFVILTLWNNWVEEIVVYIYILVSKIHIVCWLFVFAPVAPYV